MQSAIKREKSIFIKIIGWVIGTLILSVTFVTVSLTVVYTQNYEKTLTQNMTQSFATVTLNFEQFLQQLSNTIAQVDLHTELHVTLSQEEYDIYEFLQWEREAVTFFTLFSSFSDAYDIQLMMVGANGYTYNVNTTATNLPTEYLSEMQVTKDSMQDYKKLFYDLTPENLYSPHDNSQILVTKSLYNLYSGRYNGNVYAVISENTLNSLMPQVSQGERFLLLDSDGVIISDTDRENILSTDEELLSLVVAQDESVQPQNVVYRDKNYWIMAVQSNMGGSYLVQMTDGDLLYRDIYSLWRTSIIILAIILILATVICWSVVRGITNPISQLSRTMKEYHNNKNSATVNLKGCREVVDVSDSFNRMVGNINYYIDELEHEHEQTRNAELQTLQMQIQPHFLCNILASIKTLIDRDDKEEAQDMLLALSDLIRRTLGDLGENITLRREIDFLVAYTKLYKHRYNTKVQLLTLIPPELLSANVPKLILQPLVENSVIHAFDGGTRSGSIQISASEQNGVLTIEVIDNGKGMDEHTVNAIFDNSRSDIKNRVNHIGVANVKERLQLKYGDECTFDIHSKLNLGTHITLKFPFTQNRNDDEKDIDS